MSRQVVRPSPCVGRAALANHTAALECLLPLELSKLEAIVMHIYIDEGFVEASVNNQVRLFNPSGSCFVQIISID